MGAGVETIQNRIVVGNDLLEAKRASIGSSMAVGGKNHVITEADSAADAGVDAILSHASDDHDIIDSGGAKARVESRFKKGVAGAFADDQFIGARRDFGPELPARSSGFETMTGTAVVLNVNHGDGGTASTVDKADDLMHGLVERAINFFFAFEVREIQDSTLDVDDHKRRFFIAHNSSEWAELAIKIRDTFHHAPNLGIGEFGEHR